MCVSALQLNTAHCIVLARTLCSTQCQPDGETVFMCLRRVQIPRERERERERDSTSLCSSVCSQSEVRASVAVSSGDSCCESVLVDLCVVSVVSYHKC